MNRLRPILAVLLTFVALTSRSQQCVTVDFQPRTSLTIGSNSEGVSAGFCGSVNGNVIMAGGSNFPDTPAAQGGTKRIYDDVRVLQDNCWFKAGKLPNAAAYGATINVPEGVVCLGGTDGSQGLKSAFLITSVTSEGRTETSHQADVGYKGETHTQHLPDLPESLEQCAAAYGAGAIWLAGTKKLYKLTWPTGEKWEAVSDIPSACRSQACAVVQNAATGPCFYLLGGYDNDSKTVFQDGLAYDIKLDCWHKCTEIPGGAVGAVATTQGASFILVMGGVNTEIFEKAIRGQYGDDYLTHGRDWYQFRDSLLVYNTITDTWCSIAKSPLLARAGAGLSPLSPNRWLYVNGELKPGVRASSVTEIALQKTTEFGTLNWSILAFYLIAMLALGVYFMKRENGEDDFFKGGGRIPWWAAGISIYATMLSAITYMSIPAKAYATDWTYYPMLITILIVSFPVIKYYLPFFRKLKVASAYEYLETRFNLTTRLLASGLFIVFMVARMALVLYLPSLALTAVTGIDMDTCIVLMGAVTIVYCTMGGVEAVIWGDVIQGIILVGGAIFACVYLLGQTEGGFAGAWQIAIDEDKMRLFDWSFDYRTATFWVAIVGGLANNLISYTSDQTVIQRYMTTKDEKAAGRGILMNGLMSVFISVAFYVIGTGLYTFYKTHPAAMDFTMERTDAIFPFFMMSQMPAGVAGLLIAAIFAATMSTISSNINSVATAFTVDFWQRFKCKGHSVKVARIACVASGLIGVGIALLMCTWDILSLLDYFNTILGLLTSGLGGLFLIGRFFPNVNGRAALTGFVVATATVITLSYTSDVSFLLYGAIGIVVSVIVALVANLFSKQNKIQE